MFLDPSLRRTNGGLSPQLGNHSRTLTTVPRQKEETTGDNKKHRSIHLAQGVTVHTYRRRGRGGVLVCCLP